MTDTGRLSREAEFHDRWANEIDATTALVDESFTAVTAIENAYILREFGDVKGLRILDYGSGAAEAGVYFAKLGAKVVATDVSPGMLEAAKRLAGHHGVEIETRLVTGNAIPGDRGEFDRIYGNGVLHHVDMNVAVPEIARIIKPDGLGCFIEPLSYNPAIAVYRRMAETMRTPDEHPLRFGDIKRFEPFFAEVSHREFWLTSLAIFGKFFLIDRAHPSRERYWKKVITDAPANAWWFKRLPQLDEQVLELVPILSAMCWNTVIRVNKLRNP